MMSSSVSKTLHSKYRNDTKLENYTLIHRPGSLDRSVNIEYITSALCRTAETAFELEEQ